jgi:hypothetical protein
MTLAAMAALVLTLAANAGCSSSPSSSTGTAGTTGTGGGAGTGGGGGSVGVAGNGGSSGTAGSVLGGAGGTGGRGGTGGSAGRGGTGGSGGDPFAGATMLTVGAAPISGSLADLGNARINYKFDGTQGELIQIATTTGPTPFDPTYPDLIITLYGTDQKQLAQAQDPWMRNAYAPTLFTVLPATGTYYISIQNCYAVHVTNCRVSAGMVNRGFTIAISDVVAPIRIDEGAEPANDTPTGAAAITYTKAGGSSYVPLLVHGVFSSKTDKDTYTFTVPTDAPVAAGARARANFWIQGSSADGNGSTARASKVYVIDPADTSGAHVADFDAWDFSNQRDSLVANLTFPVQLGKTYQFVINPQSSLDVGSNAFYLFQHLGGAGPDAPLMEAEPNDTLATADTLAAITNPDGTYTFTVDGDLSPAGTDVDFHKLQLPSGVTSIKGQCMAARIGSGLALLKYGLVDSAGTLMVEQTEATNTDYMLSTLTIPAGGFTLKVSATSQASKTTGSSYICRLVAKP